ncbi:hypothetical protein M0804_014933 [Polistes exclamans]|nr:hypothetical protein M0804_014941 [Polistes exclamans]KAI4474279.1 hypothetical protein M0804_014933 [Polistes exclamans]
MSEHQPTNQPTNPTNPTNSANIRDMYDDFSSVLGWFESFKRILLKDKTTMMMMMMMMMMMIPVHVRFQNPNFI